MQTGAKGHSGFNDHVDVVGFLALWLPRRPHNDPGSHTRATKKRLPLFAPLLSDDGLFDNGCCWKEGQSGRESVGMKSLTVGAYENTIRIEVRCFRNKLAGRAIQDFDTDVGVGDQ